MTETRRRELVSLGALLDWPGAPLALLSGTILARSPGRGVPWCCPVLAQTPGPTKLSARALSPSCYRRTRARTIRVANIPTARSAKRFRSLTT